MTESTPSVTHSLQVITDLQTILTDAIDVAKHGIGVNAVKDLLGILSAIRALVGDSKQALPELKALTADEAATLSSSLYTMVQAVLASIEG